MLFSGFSPTMRMGDRPNRKHSHRVAHATGRGGWPHPLRAATPISSSWFSLAIFTKTQTKKKHYQIYRVIQLFQPERGKKGDAELLLQLSDGDTQGQTAQGSEHLAELWVALLIAGGLDHMACKGPFQLKPFYIYYGLSHSKQDQFATLLTEEPTIGFISQNT